MINAIKCSAIFFKTNFQVIQTAAKAVTDPLKDGFLGKAALKRRMVYIAWLDGSLLHLQDINKLYEL